MTRKKVFVGFDYDKDKSYKFLLEAWDAHSTFYFTFIDHSSKEIKNTYDSPEQLLSSGA
ncbi:hypothetical protein AB4271_16660 [Vibrio splendidus]